MEEWWEDADTSADCDECGGDVVGEYTECPWCGADWYPNADAPAPADAETGMDKLRAAKDRTVHTTIRLTLEEGFLTVEWDEGGNVREVLTTSDDDDHQFAAHLLDVLRNAMRSSQEATR